MPPPELLSIANARQASKRLGLTSMIVLQELPDGRWGYTSYGKDRAHCDRARKIADHLFDQLGDAVASA
jgi:hypothetical protein